MNVGLSLKGYRCLVLIGFHDWVDLGKVVLGLSGPFGTVVSGDLYRRIFRVSRLRNQ